MVRKISVFCQPVATKEGFRQEVSRILRVQAWSEALEGWEGEGGTFSPPRKLVQVSQARGPLALNYCSVHGKRRERRERWAVSLWAPFTHHYVLCLLHSSPHSRYQAFNLFLNCIPFQWNVSSMGVGILISFGLFVSWNIIVLQGVPV